MKLPTRFQIKGHTWIVKRKWGLFFDGVKCDGLCELDTRTIYIEHALHESEVFPTFLHELNHAIIFEIHILNLPPELEDVLVEGLQSVYLDLFKFRWKS